MPVRTITTRYGTSALEALRTVVRDAKRDRPMAPVTLLVPSNLAGIVARRSLARGLDPASNGVAGVSIATLPRLAERLAAPALHPRRPTTNVVLSAAWRAALAKAPGIFAPVMNHPATVRALVAAHRELRDLSDEGLAGVAGASTLAAELVRLHRDVVAALAGSWYDQTDLLLGATGLVGDGVGWAEIGRPVLYLPQQLTRAEAGLAAALGRAPEVELDLVVGLTDVTRADRAVLRSLAPLGLADLQRGKPRTATRMLHASDSDDEVRCVVRDVVAALEHVPAARIAVLYGSASPYSRLLAEHFAAAGVAVNGPGTRPVVERAIARGFLGVLGLAADDLPRGPLFTAISEAPTRTFEGALVPAARWERLSRSAAVVSGDDWQRRLGDYASSLKQEISDLEASDDPKPSMLEGLQRELDSVLTLRSFAITLRERLAEGAALTTWPELSAWAATLLTDLYGDAETMARMPAEEQYAAAALTSAIDALATLDAFEPAADLDALVKTLTLELESALPRIGRFGDGVLVAPVSAAIGLDADRVYVLGLAEDAYPGRHAEDALLLDRVRQASGGELGTYRDKLDAQHRHLLAAFDAAGEVVVSFPRGDLRRSTGRLPTRWLLPTLHELAGDRSLPATQWASATSAGISGSPSFALSLTAAAMPASEQEWRTQSVALGARLDDDVVRAASDLLAARASARFTRFDGNLSGVGGLPDFAAGERRLSPTALESYATCPHAYFVERLLRAQPIEQPEEILVISALDVGNLMHEAMDRLISEQAGSLPGYGESWTPRQRQRLRDITLELADEFERRGTTGHRSLWLAERDRILADLDDLLDSDDRRRREEWARVVRSELRFGFGDDDPVEVVVPRGVVRFRGSADMVDERSDGSLLVIDLKTGGTSRFATIKKDPIAAGTKLQLPVYARAARQLLHANRADAAYWFVRRGKRDWIEVQLSEELDERFTDAVSTLTASIADGLFPAKAPDQPDFLWVQCAYCNPDRIGHGEVRTRWERKRRDPVLRDLVALLEPGALEEDA